MRRCGAAACSGVRRRAAACGGVQRKPVVRAASMTWGKDTPEGTDAGQRRWNNRSKMAAIAQHWQNNGSDG